MAPYDTVASYFDEMIGFGFLGIRPAEPGYWVALHRYAFTVAIVKGRMFDRYELTDRWCYSEAAAAVEAFAAWDGVTGEPDGWIKHPASGRCRYGGDPDREVFNWALEAAK